MTDRNTDVPEIDVEPLTLGDLVGDVDVFAREHWGQAPLRHRTGRSCADLARLLDLDAISSIVDSTLRTPLVRLAQSGTKLHRDEYTARVRIAGADLDDVADPVEVHRRFADGATIVLQGLHRTWAPLRDTARALAAELDHPVQINAYLSPPHAAGLPRHADVHDVFAVQLHGVKGWDVEGVGQIELAAGDVLYVPRGVSHEARTAASASLHLTIGVPAVTYRDVVRRVLDGLDADGLDAPLPIGYSDRARSRFAAAVPEHLAAVAAAIESSPADRIVERETARARSRRRPSMRGRLRDVIAANAVTGGSVVVRRPGADVVLDIWSDEEGRCVLRIDGSRVLRLPGHARPALDVALEGIPFRPAELPGLTGDGGVVLVRRLMREGAVTAVAGR